MSDILTATDPIIGWEAITPTHRPLADLRGKVSDAWEKYFQACDRYQDGECKFEHLEFTRLQAEALEASYKRKYDELNAAPLPECTCFLPEQACSVCREQPVHGDDGDYYPFVREDKGNDESNCTK